MPEQPLHILSAYLDLLGLVTVLGVLACRLWVLPQDQPGGRGIAAAAWMRLRRILGWALALITVASFLLLAARAMQMSRQPFGALPQVLPIVLQKTHYGAVWFVRMGALAGLWSGWWALGRTGRVHVPAAMFAAAAIIAWSYSATGHASDWGDFTWAEWLHWLHVLFASLWGGSLFTVALALSPLLIPQTVEHKAFIAAVMHRLSRVIAFAMTGVLATGVFNAIVQLGGVRALWESDYGRMLTLKLLLVLAVIFLWILNRFTLVPALRDWLGAFRAPHETKTPAPGSGKGTVGKMILWHRRLMNVAAFLLAAVLLCAVLLAFQMPPRRHVMMMPMQTSERSAKVSGLRRAALSDSTISAWLASADMQSRNLANPLAVE